MEHSYHSERRRCRLDKKRLTYFTLGVGVLLLVVVILLAWSGRRSPGGIVLPEEQTDSDSVEDSGGESRLNVVEITPETVGVAISVRSRPLSYSRTQVVETFWSGGSGQSVSQVYVSGSRTRLDTQLADGSVRHMLISGGMAGVWYDDETEWAVLRTPQLNADLAARTLSYETVRDLPVERIAGADYREKDGAWCLYVETLPDGAGYADRYWISVDSGLLYAAERIWDRELVYRFSAGTPDTAAVEEGLFLLPDGSALSGGE